MACTEIFSVHVLARVRGSRHRVNDNSSSHFNGQWAEVQTRCGGLRLRATCHRLSRPSPGSVGSDNVALSSASISISIFTLSYLQLHCYRLIFVAWARGASVPLPAFILRLQRQRCPSRPRRRRQFTSTDGSANGSVIADIHEFHLLPHGVNTLTWLAGRRSRSIQCKLPPERHAEHLHLLGLHSGVSAVRSRCAGLLPCICTMSQGCNCAFS